MRHLTFDLTDGSDDILTLEAMASTREAEHAAVMAEAVQLLAWAESEFGGRHGPVEDGNAWDHELLVQHEPGGWVTVTLTFSASVEFAEAFQAKFGEADED
ncbi:MULTISPECIES: hypothetical protein [Roseateles]|uniref:Uncharacterized protein n=1 Tax=Pelomonas aquatica TaxID=431058 RepID=A0ABU1ZE61_9BURK|nr:MULTISPECIES: hypothetical protein [Roseateles]KQY85522.1 hypothetical protein ASD35_23205 [Pelomonas sp. Root1444]MDR7298907.1 hypothetical protein [Pelomonas aquatica]